jgi:hypothetical protein
MQGLAELGWTRFRKVGSYLATKVLIADLRMGL